MTFHAGRVQPLKTHGQDGSGAGRPNRYSGHDGRLGNKRGRGRSNWHQRVYGPLDAGPSDGLYKLHGSKLWEGSSGRNILRFNGSQ